MTRAEAFYFAAILFVGTASLFLKPRNPTALAMVAMWFFGRAIYELTGEGAPIRFMVLQDCCVIAAMFVKDDWYECVYRNTRHQLLCLWLERTPWDKAILVLFPLVWLLYAASGSFQYWTLYGIGLLQLALASHEAVYFWLRTKANSPRTDATGDNSESLYAPVRGEAYG